MDSYKRLTQSASSWASWLLHCWTLRDVVLDLTRSYAASPTHVQLDELKETVERLKQSVAAEQAEVRKVQEAAEHAADGYRAQYAKLKVKYDTRIHSTQVEQVEALKNELGQERDARHLLQVEVVRLKSDAEAVKSEYQVARDGNRALLRFIHTGHRLNVKFDPDSIRAALKRGNDK